MIRESNRYQGDCEKVGVSWERPPMLKDGFDRSPRDKGGVGVFFRGI